MTTALLKTMAKLESTFSRFQLTRAKDERKQRLRRAFRDTILRSNSAFSPESIVAYVLRQRGWTRKWRGGDLSGKQHLSLLEDCRQFTRARLRHEAETLFDWHGEEIERSIASRAARAVGSFFQRAKLFVREAIVAGAMLLKGDEPLTESEFQAIDRQAKRQAEYLEGFEREVKANPPREISDLSSQVIDVMAEPMSADQFIARAESYGNSVWQGAQQAERKSTRETGFFVSERRIMGHPVTQHCPDCPPISYSSTGWVPVGTLPDIGDTECGGACLCHFEYQDATGRVFTGTPKSGSGPKLKRIPNPPQAKTAEPPVPEPKKETLPVKDVPKPAPAKSDKPPLAQPIPSIKEIVEGAGSPHPVEYYEEL